MWVSFEAARAAACISVAPVEEVVDTSCVTPSYSSFYNEAHVLHSVFVRGLLYVHGIERSDDGDMTCLSPMFTAAYDRASGVTG